MNQKDLTNLLIKASEEYYNTGISSMSDLEFDQKVAELKKLEEESGVVLPGSPTQNVGVTTVKELKTVKHEYPALSLDKVKYKDREELKKWLSNKQAIISWKCDGLTLVLTYDDGKLTSAVTRGNGTEGSDVTHNAKFFNGIPQKIPYEGHLVVRGEAMMTYAEFERVNAAAGGIYENPRNLAAATIQMLDAGESRKREIIFRAFELVTPEPEDMIIDEDTGTARQLNLAYMQDRLDWLQYIGFDVVDRECCDASDILQKIEEWKEDIKNLPYPTDGLVISYQDLVEGWELGSTGHHPRWAMALKWTDETVETTIRDIEWSVGKTGIITPVAVFDEVRMGLGSNVTRASLHNLSIMKRLSDKTGENVRSTLIIGSKAEVYMANMIIPQVASIERTEETTSAETPFRCPVCGELTSAVWNPDSNVAMLMCTNHDGCPAQQIGRLMNAFGKDGLYVKGLGESQIQDLMDAGIVNSTPYSFYDLVNSWKAFCNNPHRNLSEPGYLAVQNLLEKDGWGQKKWDNLMDAIDASRKTTLQKFLYSLNIPLLGNDLSKKLSKYWNGDINQFISFIEGADAKEGYHRETGYNALTSIDGVGNDKASNIVNWAAKMIETGKWTDEIKSLIGELSFPEVKDVAESNNTLSGLTFVITGSVHVYKNRDEFKASVEARGGKVAGSVSKNTTALVNNDVTSTSGKNQKAKELGIEIISEDEFIRRFSK